MKEQMPLVSILIPTYNRPDYFKIAFESALNQTYSNIEIIVCDNSTNEKTSEFIKPFLSNKRVKYYRNYEAKTKKDNFKKFKDIVKGEYINWLMDDDVLHIDKIKIMVDVYLNNNVSIVTSFRNFIDGDGNLLKNKSILNETAILNGKDTGKKLLLNLSNFIGEPTTVLIKRDLLENHYWEADCRGYKAISDVVMWLELLKKGDLAYIVNPLSSFRIHNNQEQSNINVIILSRIEWYKIFVEEYDDKYFIESNDEYLQFCKKIIEDNALILELCKDNINNIDINIYEEYANIIKNIKELISIL